MIDEVVCAPAEPYRHQRANGVRMHFVPAPVRIVSSLELFPTEARTRAVEPLGPGAAILRAHVQREEAAILRVVEDIATQSPYRHLITPGGYRMSVAMTNCGELGWVSDRRGYRYEPNDPLTGRPWPAMPELLARIARDAAHLAGYAPYRPEACLINHYEPGARLSLHIDKDEEDAASPIVSISIGTSATFLWGGLRRADRLRRIVLHSGDVVVWGGESRFVYHGVAPLREQWHPLTGALRVNLTFRAVRLRQA